MDLINDTSQTKWEMGKTAPKGIGLNKFYKVAYNIKRTHPFPVLRAYELNKWGNSEEYKSIYSGNYESRTEETSPETHTLKKCPHCKEKIDVTLIYCNNCGQNTNRLKNQYDQSGYESFVTGIKDGVNNVVSYFGSKKGLKQSESNKKVCPKCNTEFFDPEIRFCPIDGNELIEDRRRGGKWKSNL